MIEIEVPDKLQIGGFWYNIVCNPEKDVDLKERNLLGEYTESDLTCAVRSDVNEQQKCKTLIEEISHAIEVVYASKQIAHSDIQDLSQGWFQVLEQLGVRLVKNGKPVVTLEVDGCKD